MFYGPCKFSRFLVRLSVFHKRVDRYSRRMTPSMLSLMPPAEVRGMKVLDREKFKCKIKIPTLRVPVDSLTEICKVLRNYYMKLCSFKPVDVIPDDISHRLIYMNPDLVKKWTDIEELHREKFKEQGITESEFSLRDVELTYENWPHDKIFKAVLPEGQDIVSSFSTTGHIIHLNLKEHLLDYASLIGQVLIDRIKTCKTVVNKTKMIDSPYRIFDMEVVAGERKYFVTVKENNCNFSFNFSKVYFNTRLGKEHERILSFLKPNDILFDAFCGVGPFALPAAKRKIIVYANDLNPESFYWLNVNAKNNKIVMSYLNTYNLDAKEFICNNFRDYIMALLQGTETLKEGGKVHVTMNLPANAIDFMPLFHGLIQDSTLIDKFNFEIIIYLYSFVYGKNYISSIQEMLQETMGYDMSSYVTDVFNVRNVSRNKDMIRTTINLHKDILFGLIKSRDLTEEPPVKKRCKEEVLDSGEE